MFKWFLLKVERLMPAATNKLLSMSLFSVLICQQVQVKHEGEKACYRISTTYYMSGAYFCPLILNFFQTEA